MHRARWSLAWNALLQQLRVVVPSIDQLFDTGDVSDLDLTFSVDEDVMGSVVTTPLILGGAAQPVTNQNRILYVHLMADYKLNK